MRSPSSSRIASSAGPQLLGGRDELLAGIDRDRLQRLQLVPGQRLEPRDALDLVAEELDAQGVLAPGGAELDRVAAHAELAARELDVVAGVLQVHQPVQEVVARHLHARRGSVMTIAS